MDDGANEYVEYTFPFFDLDPGEEKWNNKPTYEMDVKWFESYSKSCPYCAVSCGKKANHQNLKSSSK